MQKSYVVFALLHVTQAILVTFGFTMDSFIIPMWLLTAIWGALATATVYEYKEPLVAWLRKLSGKPPLRKPTKPDYEVISWWGETGNAFADSARHLVIKRYPKTIFIRKTGEVRELPYPPEANKIPNNG